MRLIHTKTLQLTVFNDERKIPPYAILSHRWVDGQEVLYKDLLKQRNENLEGWWKLRFCCAHANNEGLEYVWIDTCCIDKSSSAELSEAINSMYRWYANSTICYAYLSDVEYSGNVHWEQQFVSSLWFTRSWTLQELLAPSQLVFYDKVWDKIGARSDLPEEIAEGSGVHLTVFTSPKLDLEEWSVAQRMSWASRRTATRLEDVAYSLLGIFNVNMPLLYGEGEKAFLRLQQEIIRQSNDHTIFAWSGHGDGPLTLLATSPAAFRDNANVVRRGFQDPKAYALTNLGLAIELPLEQWLPGIYWAGLNCTNNDHDQLGIWLAEDEQQNACYHVAWVEDGGALDKPKPTKPLASKHRFLLSRRRNQLTCVDTAVSISLAIRSEQNVLKEVYPVIARWSLETVYSSREGPFRSPVPHSTLKAIVNRLLEEKHAWAPFSALKSRSIAAKSTRSFYAPDCHPQWLGVDLRKPSFKSSSHGIMCGFTSSRASYGLTALMLGYDRQFNPWCILLLVPSSSRRQKLVALADDSTVPLETGSMSLYGKDFWQCDGFEEHGWLRPSKQSDTSLLKHPRGIQPGLWALKGDKSLSSVFRFECTQGYIGDGTPHTDYMHVHFNKQGTNITNIPSYSLQIDTFRKTLDVIQRS